MNKYLFRTYGCVTLLFVLLLLNSCAMVEVILGARYQKMPTQPFGNERVIDKVSLAAGIVEFDSPQEVPALQRMGETYRDSPAKNGPNRHRDEPILDDLVRVASKRYPSETVELRNAVCKYSLLGPKVEMKVVSVSHVKVAYEYLKVCYADVITTEPMPTPYEFTVDISLDGVSREDLYRRANNWFDDRRYEENKTSVGVQLQKADFDVGRIRGDYVFNVTTGQNYKIISTFTVDFHDSKAQFRLSAPRLQRLNTDEELLQSIKYWTDIRQANIARNSRSPLGVPMGPRGVVGVHGSDIIAAAIIANSGTQVLPQKTEEPIFLQSIANLANPELKKFFESFKSGIHKAQ
jgi:hypothetical protein